MKLIYIISIIILSLSISSWGGNAQPPPSPPAAYPWEGFRLTLQWPVAFCELNAATCIKNSLLNTFTIHGLWPYKAQGTSLRNCKGAEFTVNSVANFLAEMHLAWPSFDNRRSTEGFWKHEWDAHGKCSEALLKQTDYFRTSLAFRKAFDILGLLNQEGIYPNNALYPPELIKNAIKKSLNSMPTLVCKQKPNDSERVLTEIYLCVNQLATKFVDCPTPTSADCDKYPLKFVSLASQLQIAPRSNASSSASTYALL